MTTRARQPCSDSDCPNLKPCPTHTTKAWASSDRGQRLSSRPWERLRKHVLARDPLCQDGRTCNGEALSVEVDHIVAGDNHDLENLQAICKDCHKAKTQEEAHHARTNRRSPPLRQT